MPYIRLETTEPIAPERRASLCQRLSRLVAEGTGKPETYVMVVVEDGLTMLHAGAPGPAAFAEIRSIGGLSSQVNRELAQGVCRLLDETLGVPGERIYLNFAEVEAGRWGHDGTTFG